MIMANLKKEEKTGNDEKRINSNGLPLIYETKLSFD